MGLAEKVQGVVGRFWSFFHKILVGSGERGAEIAPNKNVGRLVPKWTSTARIIASQQK